MPGHSHAQEPQHASPTSTPAQPATAPAAAWVPPAARSAIPHDPVLARKLAAVVQARTGVPSLQRKVKIGNKAWLKKNAKLTAISPALAGRYQPYVVEQVKTLAAAWRDDSVETNRTFNSEDAFYQAVFDHVITQGGAGTPSGGDLWNKLKIAAQTQGNVTEVPWSSFNAQNAQSLETELLACGVQISGNTGTTACHGNTHNKLPKKVAPPGGQALKDLAPSAQALHTPYIEFLIPGHKKETSIERGILDRVSGQIYLTAHYDVGSFLWLSGAPANLVADWQAKALAYVQGL